MSQLTLRIRRARKIKKINFFQFFKLFISIQKQHKIFFLHNYLTYRINNNNKINTFDFS